ncbi:Hpt domain-containing protein [Flavobacterium sp. Fl-318]|uniref:Hpt domain-containing protein n=1 Tax=Flavobacterium cupriresistens TaxID=2893885 RepID=A0ABU4RHP3_9FLAO|nr:MULTISPECIES: Hpt domain-containing protein [unclassified Flavobacterium]MDX6192104.1 Hpt domain-containing protein [Flavobacterium sp. Fl-318]UFH44625.1 Hpt domain-containing protein [Flavobacterium sp. F-323]
MEKPNLNYIDQLCGEDDAFKRKMIAIIKKELPLEIASYHENMEAENYKLAADCVHKLKHKISILSLEKNYDVAHQYENNLLNGTLHSEEQFESILHLIQSFVNEL